VPSRTVTVASASGLHARPAATFAQAAAATGLDIVLQTSTGETADAGSLLEVMTLGVDSGDEVTLLADGPDADDVLDRLAALLATDLDAA
jgi:phosphotransferase system HPr (HPr) family protein